MFTSSVSAWFSEFVIAGLLRQLVITEKILDYTRIEETAIGLQ
jgi:hypothetical protein